MNHDRIPSLFFNSLLGAAVAPTIVAKLPPSRAPLKTSMRSKYFLLLALGQLAEQRMGEEFVDRHNAVARHDRGADGDRQIPIDPVGLEKWRVFLDRGREI